MKCHPIFNIYTRISVCSAFEKWKTDLQSLKSDAPNERKKIPIKIYETEIDFDVKRDDDDSTYSKIRKPGGWGEVKTGVKLIYYGKYFASLVSAVCRISYFFCSFPDTRVWVHAVCVLNFACINNLLCLLFREKTIKIVYVCGINRREMFSVREWRYWKYQFAWNKSFQPKTVSSQTLQNCSNFHFQQIITTHTHPAHEHWTEKKKKKKKMRTCVQCSPKHERYIRAIINYKRLKCI